MSNIIIVGCGRVGSQLAIMLSNNGDNVCVIDKDAEAFSNLGRNFNGQTLQGIGFDEETLMRSNTTIRILCSFSISPTRMVGVLI